MLSTTMSTATLALELQCGVGNDRDRVFNIQSQAERYDGKGKYQRLWLQKELF